MTDLAGLRPKIITLRVRELVDSREYEWDRIDTLRLVFGLDYRDAAALLSIERMSPARNTVPRD